MTFAWSRYLAAMTLAAIAGGKAVGDDDFNASAGAPTFTEHVAPIMVSRCVACHRPGENSPMTLTSYAEARPWAKSIKKAVQSREMPPWDANPAHGKFSNDLSITDAEIATLVKWVDGGAPEGDPTKMPAMPKFTEGWQLGEPDYVIELEEFEVPADGPDRFPNLEAKITLPEDRWIRAVEVRPGDIRVAHHLVAFATNAGAISGGGLGSALAGWAVGMPPAIYPEGMGRVVKKNTNLMVNMHYHPCGEVARDRTRIGLHFGEGELKKEVGGAMATDFMLRIPPRAENHQVNASYTFRQDSQLTALTPHMHMRGKDMKFTANFPDGRSEILLDVPTYDFNWQWRYILEHPLSVPKGTRIDVVAHFDNSDKNPNNPDPNQELTFGEESTDEMMIGAMEYYVDEGVSPHPINLGEVIDGLLESHPSEHAYRVTLNAGFMKFPTALILPPSGEATWYFPLGEQAITLPVKDVKWEGSKFTFTMEMLGRGELNVEGTLAADGSISGKFDATDLKLEEGGPTSMFQMVGFTGQKAESKQISKAN